MEQNNTPRALTVGHIVAEVMKREGVDVLLTYPLNPLTERCAEVNIRPIVVRQERIGVHMADAMSRLSSGEKVGVFACQEGPGIENAFGAVAQGPWSEGVPLIVFPSGGGSFIRPAFNATMNFQHITKHAEIVTSTSQVIPALRRAFSLARNGRPGPVLIEFAGGASLGTAVPGVMSAADVEYTPSRRVLTAPDPRDVDAAAAALIAARRPLIYAGQGVHYAKAWAELKAVAELLEAPVCSSLEGKSAFPENHPLALGSGGPTMSRAVDVWVQESDLVFGAGASFSATGFGIQFPTRDKTFVHNTNESYDINKNIQAKYPMLGDSKLALGMLHEALKDRLKKPRGLTPQIAARIKEVNEPWMAEWLPRLTSESKPLEPYRVIWDLMHIADVPNTSSRTMPAARATSCRRSGSPPRRCRTSAGARARSWATDLASPWARSWRSRTSCASTWRRGHRHDGHGFRDLRAREDPDHVHPVQQLRHAHGRQADGLLAREVPFHRHLRQLRGVRQGAGLLHRARDRSGPGGPCPGQWHRCHQGRQARAAGVHHHA